MIAISRKFMAGCVALAVAAALFAGIAGADETKPHIVFLTGEDPSNYEAAKTLPVFAERLEREEGFRTTVLMAEGPLVASRFPNLEVISEADALVIFFRRRTLKTEQLDLIKAYLKQGKPLVGIRTANHAFSVHPHPERGLPKGFEAWWEFVPEILGCENRGYGPPEPGTAVAPAPGKEKHPILKGVEPLEWHSEGNVYLVAPLVDEKAEVLLLGKVEDAVEPVAWTRRTQDGSPVFYTSLGYPSDFDAPQFRRLLINGIRWTLDESRKARAAEAR